MDDAEPSGVGHLPPPCDERHEGLADANRQHLQAAAAVTVSLGATVLLFAAGTGLIAGGVLGDPAGQIRS
jgi:hypothetical protein